MRIDPQRSLDWLDQRIGAEHNPRHRAIIENYRQHLASEVTANFDDIMGTLVDEPVYHSYTPESLNGEAGPKNRAEVEAFYKGMFDARINVLERHVDRLIVTDDVLVSEGSIDHVYPGDAILARGRSEDADGAPVEADAFYLMRYRICAVLPYAGDGIDVKMAGEDTYTLVPHSAPQRIPADDVPDLLR
jgi:hypothetical protein